MFAIAVWLWFFLSVYCCLWFVGYISIHDVYLFTIEVLHTKLEGVILHYVYVSKESLFNFTDVVYSLLLKVSCFAWLEKKQKKFTKIYFLRFFMVSLIHFQFLLFFLFSLCYYSCFCKFKVCFLHCVKSVTIRSFSGPYFPGFGLNTERYRVCLRIPSECGKMGTGKTPNTDIFTLC